ncbi:MAG: protein kinase [Caldilineaceae bacterium]
MTALPSQIGPYHIHRLLGTGGMSTVYVAADPRNATTVALKVLPPHFASDTTYLQRFLREGQHARQLHHPNLVSVFDAGEADGRYYIAMELIQGPTLSQAMRERSDLLPLGQIVHILRQVAAGLDHAHREGFLHRDIKPSNILIEGELISPSVRAVLSDFGVAQLLNTEQTMVTQQGYSIGTPTFMSPEQARGDEQLDHRSDIYSLGVVAYLLCTGRLPFKADNQYGLMRKIVDDPPAPASEWNPHLPAGVVYVLNRVLAKEPDRRYNSAGLFVAALAEAAVWAPTAQQDHPPTPSRPITAVQPQMQPSGMVTAAQPVRRRTPWIVGALIGLVGLLLAAMLINQGSQWLPFLRQQAVAPVVIVPYTDPDGHFELHVPARWRQIRGPDRIEFEAPDLLARFFVQHVTDAPAGSDAGGVLDHYVAQYDLPYADMELISEESRTLNGRGVVERQVRGHWLGSDVQIQLIAVPNDAAVAGDAYVLGSVVGLDNAERVSDLLTAVNDSFALNETPAEPVAIAQGDSGQPTATTRPPTSTPIRPLTATPAGTETPSVLVARPITAMVESATATAQITLTAVLTDTNTPTATPTATEVPATATDTPAPTATSTVEPTATATHTPASTETATPTDTATDAPTAAPTATATIEPTATATDTPAPTDIATDTPTATETQTPEPTVTDAPTATATNTPAPTATDTHTPEPTATPTATDTPAPTDTATATSTATSTATATVTATDTLTPEPTATDTATATDTPAPTATTTATPTQTDTATATRLPTNTPIPTPAPTDTPTATFTASATDTPEPTDTPAATDAPTAISTTTPDAIATAREASFDATATAQATILQGAIKATLTALAPAAASPTPTLTPSVTPPPTATFTRTPTSTATPNATATARAEATRQSATATAQATILQGSIRATLTALARTRAPTATRTPSATATRTPTAAATATATVPSTPAPPPVPPSGSVTLLGPLDAVLRGRQVFRWSSSITLRGNQYYEMVFWPVGADPLIAGFSPVGAGVATEVVADLDKAASNLSHLLIGGQEYEWGVLLVELNPYRKLQYLGGGHRFRFEFSNSGGGGGGGGGGSAPPTATPRG